MFNILLDEFPNKWGEYELDTDFRIGIMLSMAMGDKELSNFEKMAVVADLLFKNDIPEDSIQISECVQWFINGWTHDNYKKGSTKEVMDFDADQGRIYSAFLSQYRIDLNVEQMHFWKFMHLLTNLDECNFTRVVDIRTKDLNSKMSNEERKYYANAKRTYAIRKEDIKSAEDIEAENEVTNTFLNYIGKN